MYTVKAFVNGTEYVLYNPKQNLYIRDGYFEIGDNINGQAEFTVYPDHRNYDYVKKLTTDVVFYNDGTPEFYGRILYDDEDDFSGAKKVFCEGELAFFCDSIQPIKVYQDYTVKRYLADLIDIHNSQVEERKQFVLGKVTVTDSNDSLYRYSNYESTRELMKDRLTDRLGGHFVVRHEEGLRILDYLSDEDFYRENTQTIEFRKNLLEFSRNIDASEIATRIIPLGARKENKKDAVGVLEDRITIADANGGVIYVTDDNAVKEYGKITKAVIWDDVTVPANLMKKGKEYLKSVQYEKMILELKAIDMSVLDSRMSEFQIGDKIRCISKANGLDKEFPLTKKKIYIADFSKNTVTLGDSTSNKTYTSSNAQKTASMEEEIKSIPSKKEILKEALSEAQRLINEQSKDGYAIHVPEEFIVADDEDYKEKAKNMWRWGLGGLAHYSQGYDGPIDGVALTMDGKINGGMILAESVTAASLDAGYKKSVETAISEAKDGAIKYADQKINSSLKVLDDRISMKITSTKELVSRKDYIKNGEQENLSLDSYTVTGTVATVTASEFLNMKCLKVEFSGTGGVVIEQSVGTLPAGTYQISVEMAYPESDGNAARPSYMEYGFTGNRSTVYFSNYTADEYHSISKKLKITEASKAVSVRIYGSQGKIAYITNIRCLREVQELLDDLSAQINVTDGKITSEVKRATDKENALSSRITQTEDAITTKVSKGSISSEINQTNQKVKIKASKINFNGLVTANSYFKILTDGSFTCAKGTIGGFTVKNGSIFAKGTELSAIGNGFKVDGGFKIYCGSDTFSDQTDTFQIFNLSHVTSGGHVVFASDGSTICYLSSSSKRYKDHISDMSLGEAEKILDIPVVWFRYKEGYLDPNDQMAGKNIPGLYAEDVYSNFPEAAYSNADGKIENWNERMIIPAMLKLIQELYSERRKKE